MMFKVVPKEALLGLICIAGFVVTMLGYTQDTSLINLDVVDCYINISMLWIGFMECIAAGWINGVDQVCEKIGWSAHWYLVVTAILSSVAAHRWVSASAATTQAAMPIQGGLLASASASSRWDLLSRTRAHWTTDAQRGHRPLSILYETLLCNIEDLRAIINRQAGWNVGNISVPFVWSLLVKFVIPPVLLPMLIIKMSDEAFGACSDYPSFYQGWGCFVGFMPWILTAVRFVWPQVFDAIMPEDADFSFGRTSSFWSFKVFVETKRRFLFSIAEENLFPPAHGAQAWHPLFLALTPLSSSLRFLSSPLSYVFSRFFSSLFLFPVPSHSPSCLFSPLLSSFLFFSLLLSSSFILFHIVSSFSLLVSSPFLFTSLRFSFSSLLFSSLLFSSLLFSSLLFSSLLVSSFSRMSSSPKKNNQSEPPQHHPVRP